MTQTDTLTFDAWISNGMTASQANDSLRAIECFQNASDAAPEAGLPQFLLGAEFATLGDMARAETAFANAARLAPDFPMARYQLGLLQFSSGRAATALLTWEPLLALPESNPLPHFIHGFTALAKDWRSIPPTMRSPATSPRSSRESGHCKTRALRNTNRPTLKVTTCCWRTINSKGQCTDNALRGTIHRVPALRLPMIDPSNRLAALIRAQFAAQLRPTVQARASAAPLRPASTAGENAMSGAGGADAQIQELVALRVRALSPEDPQRRRKAFRLFLEGVLLQEFGRDRLDDKGLGELVDSVMQRMEEDAQLIQAMQDAGDVLLADAAPRRVGSGACTPDD